MICSDQRKYQVREVEEIKQYRHPPQGFAKLNFDGVAKNNPGEAGIRGVFRNDRGKTLRIFMMDCGEATNN